MSHTKAATDTVQALPTSQSYKRCVIYTRKSSEEGLEQDFNSLDAQREACEAYIQSQRHEGWRLLRDEAYLYDDGGLSGGNMERPSLIRMLDAIKADEIDVIVVYKVDRLTRSLADFARIVDVMDNHGVSFVSVTQAFNTTSSMGRLTLNVLLSFAQFEREVTAERIRDKIAASKRKGIWMGGPVPFGYCTQNKQLIIHDKEATIVQRVFKTYLKTCSLPKTKAVLDEAGIQTRRRRRKDGHEIGGIPFSIGALSAMLRNQVYIGKTRHKDEVFDGQHDSIIDTATFDAVQTQLKSAAGGNKKRAKRSNIQATNKSAPAELGAGRLLTGRLYDSAGFLMSPTHTNKQGVRYRYYVSTALAHNRAKEAGSPHRLSATRIESAVLEALSQIDSRLEQTNGPQSDFERLACIERVDVIPNGAQLIFKKTSGLISASTLPDKLFVSIAWKQLVRSQIKLPTHGGATKKEID